MILLSDVVERPEAVLLCRRLDCYHAGTLKDFIVCEEVVTCPMCGHEEVSEVTEGDPSYKAHPPFVDRNGRTLRDVYHNR